MNREPCEICGIAGFPDMIIPYSHWVQISPSGDDTGLLCPSCICRALAAKGLECAAAFMSGPARSVTSDTMALMRQFENIELALGGRKNRYGAELDDRIAAKQP